MKIDLSEFQLNNKTVAVALSGGADSMSLLHYMQSVANDYPFNLVAINVEHGIRGKSSIADSTFVTDYCKTNNIPCLCYSIDTISFAAEKKLSIEQAARLLRYDCFYDAISNKKCDVVATAHHRSDNLESVLLNLFRGTGLKGLAGISQSYDGKIIRPLINVSKDEINEYVTENVIPFVLDETNLSDDYTRNFLRLNVIPKIKEVFPEMEKSVSRLSQIVKIEDDYLDEQALNYLTVTEQIAKIPVSTPPALINRAIIHALKRLGLKKDWERAHVESVANLVLLQTGATVCLPKNLYAIREYDHLIIAAQTDGVLSSPIPFSLGTHLFNGYGVEIIKTPPPENLRDGFYFDLDKIPSSAVIRQKADGDVFTKFGGGTKKLSDYLTDLKIPLRLRDGLPILADGNDVLCIVGVAISDKIKVDETTKNIIKITRQDTNENQ